MRLRERMIADATARTSSIRLDKYAGSRPVFDVALEREHYDLAALCLLVGAVEAIQSWRREMMEALLDELEGEPPHRGSRARAHREPHGRHR